MAKRPKLTPPTPAYTDAYRTLYRANVEKINIRPNSASVLLTDPPYVIYNYITTLEKSGRMDPSLDGVWMGENSNWTGVWWTRMRKVLRDDGVAWVFANVHYMGFYLRWAHLTQLPVRGIFPCPPAEFLLAFGRVSIAPTHATIIKAICETNTYGQNKPIPFLRALLAASPPGVVFDPFAGLGSTLDAAALEGRRSVGIEIQQDLVDKTIEKWLARPYGKAVVYK